MEHNIWSDFGLVENTEKIVGSIISSFFMFSWAKKRYLKKNIVASTLTQ